MIKWLSSNKNLSASIVRVSFTAIVLSMLLMIVLVVTYSGNQAKQSLGEDLKVLAKVIGNKSAAALIFLDEKSALANLESVQFRESIIKVCIYNPEGNLFVGFTPENQIENCETKTHFYPIEQNFQHLGHLGAIALIEDSNDLLGFVLIEASTESIGQNLIEVVGASIVLCVLVLICAFLLTRKFIGGALSPLTNLHNVALKIASDPHSKLRARKEVNDEVGSLVDVFNDMLDALDDEKVALTQSETRFRVLAENSPVGIYQMDSKGKFLYANQKWFELTGLSQGNETKDFLSRVYQEDREHRSTLMREVLRSHSPRVIEYKYERSETERTMMFMEHVAPLIIRKVSGEETQGFIGSLLDISDLKNAQMDLENLAFYDPLTNLPNRRFFRDHLQLEVRHANRDRTDIALVMLDLDNFKKINDTLGHDAGDELLTRFSERLKETISQTDVISRMGGDEFMILLKDPSHHGEIEATANSVLEAIRKPLEICGHEVEVSGSIGVAKYPEDATNADELMRNADLALYLSKETGRNRLSFFSRELEKIINEKVFLERKLREALKANKLSFYVQPKWSLTDKRLVSAEVLMRWFDEDEGFIGPDRFIPVAEEAGLILEMGDWLIDEVCRNISDNLARLQLLGIRSIAINLSARQFFNQSLATKIDQTLRKHGVPASMIELELTESAVIEDIEMAIKIMERLKKIGCRLSIDDFGTGYSSLSYLKRFPIDEVKIDRSFISDIPSDQNDVEISSAIIAMAHKLGLQVVAEGVEIQEQMDFLVQQECDFAQGYLISKPIPFDQLFTDVPTVNQEMSA